MPSAATEGSRKGLSRHPSVDRGRELRPRPSRFPVAHVKVLGFDPYLAFALTLAVLKTCE